MYIFWEKLQTNMFIITVILPHLISNQFSSKSVEKTLGFSHTLVLQGNYSTELMLIWSIYIYIYVWWDKFWKTLVTMINTLHVH